MFSKTVRLTLFTAVFFAAVAGIYSRRGTTTVVNSPARLNRMFSEAEAAFGARDYTTGIAKIKELLAVRPPSSEIPYELLYFYIGLGNLLNNNLPDAEAGFKDAIKRYPNGEYTSRSYLGLGRACMMQEAPEKKEKAIDALKLAAADPKYRAEAGLWLSQVNTGLKRNEETLKVFRSLMGSDVRTPAQTTAAVEAIGVIAKLGKIEELTAYLDRLSQQSGVRDAMAWFTNQVVVRGDELVSAESYEPALIIYRSVRSRRQILDIQAIALESIRKDLKVLEARVELEKNKPIGEHSNASELAAALKPAIELSEKAMKAIEEKTDLDAALLMRRGRCLFYLKRDDEALTCFRTLIEKFPTATDAETAAYAEIMILNKRQDIEGIKEKSGQFMRKYPESPRLEQVATLAGEVLVQSGNWKDVGEFYRKMEARYPKSENLDRFVFFQGLAFFQDANFKESTPLFEKFLKTYPSSALIEHAHYYLVMSHFLSNNYEKTLDSCRDYFAKFPAGRFAGDFQYRISFIDFNDKEIDRTDKIIRELGDFLKKYPDDLCNGSMLCLMADTYKKKKEKATSEEEGKKYEDLALQCYDKVIWMKDRPDDVIQYAIDNATTILQNRKDWKGIAELHEKIRRNKPNFPQIPWGGGPNPNNPGNQIAVALKSRIADPTCEQVETLIDELVKSMVSRKKVQDIDLDALDKQLVDLLNKNIGDQKNATTDARVLYARARLAQMVKWRDLSDLYMKGIATTNIKNPSALSPALLAASGDLLLKGNDLDGAEVMFKYLNEHYKESMCSDAGPVGLGFVALGRKKPEEALRIFEDVLESNAGTSRLKETALGKLQALVDLDKLEPASKLAIEMIEDKSFRGESAAKAYMQLGLIYRKQSAKADGVQAREFLAKAHVVYQRVYVAYQGFPEICAEGYWQAYLVLKELKDDVHAQETLKVLTEHPKLQDTARAKQAREILK